MEVLFFVFVFIFLAIFSLALFMLPFRVSDILSELKKIREILDKNK